MKKDYENYILYGLLVLVVAGLIFSFSGFFGNKPAKAIAAASTDDGTGFKSINTGSTDTGDVSIELTPQKADNGQLKIKISANTHSVDLSQFDLKDITTLEYNGKVIKPVSAPALSGHHNDGELVFNTKEKINSFTIKIRGIPNVEERVFKWQ